VRSSKYIAKRNGDRTDNPVNNITEKYEVKRSYVAFIHAMIAN